VKRLIVSADDFGISPEVNEAVEQAHRDGILRAASLMVGAPAAADAVERAHRMPDLAVGLHVVLVFGRPVLPPQQIPGIVDRDGRFLTDLFRAGVRFFFRPGVRRQLEAEIRAQFERFAATGLALDHVNAQSHMHVHPTIFRLLLQVGREYGLRAIRLPREPFAPSYRAAGDRFGPRLGNALLTEPWLALMRRRARRLRIACNDYAFGVNDAGAMTEPRVLRLLADLPEGVTEMFFHPASKPFAGADPGTENYAWAAELAALTSPRVREVLALRQIERVTYGEIAALPAQR
jgi:hopanoid biosynthesis associated protein HpnK